LGPLVLRGIDSPGKAVSDAPWLEDLRASVARSVRRNLWLSSKLILVSKALTEAGISFLVLKGLPLAMQAYGNLGMRLGRDIDVLIAPEDYQATVDLLRQLGFLPAERGFPFPDNLRFGYASGEVWHLDDVLLDLHWRFTDQGLPFDMAPKAAIDGAAWVQISGCAIPVLGGVAQFLYLVHHAAKHLWMRFFWLADLVALWSGNDAPDGKAVASQAASMGLSRPLAMSLLLAEDLFNVTAPEGFWPAKVQRSDLWSLQEEWRSNAIKDQDYTRHRLLQLPNSRVWRWSFALSDGLARKIRLGFNLGFKPSMSDIRSLALPQGLRFLYWIWRPVRLICRTLGFELGKRKAPANHD